jgi:hypothetical protein
MKLISRILLVGVVSLDISVAFQGAASAATTISVATYDAQCDGFTDDTAAIQSALNDAAAAGGGTVTLPGSTCLPSSFTPSAYAAAFYNLHIPSGVTLQGVIGSKLLQGPGGRQSIRQVPAATSIRNTVVAVGNNYATIQFQNRGNGGFYSLHAMVVGSPSVTLSTAVQAANFAAGDYVAIYEHTSGDVLPAQMSQVTGVNVAAGQLTLADPVIRPFAAPSIAKVTRLAAHDIAINNVIVQGAMPLAVTETFNFSASNDQFLSDTSIGGGNVNELLLNTVEHFTFAGKRSQLLTVPTSIRSFASATARTESGWEILFKILRLVLGIRREHHNEEQPHLPAPRWNRNRRILKRNERPVRRQRCAHDGQSDGRLPMGLHRHRRVRLLRLHGLHGQYPDHQ